MSVHNPTFSIIVPTYNRPERLQECLQSLAELDYPHDRYEVIVVDDGSCNPLTAVVQPFVAKMSVRLIRQNNAGPAGARNTGAAAAQGQYLAFTDDDCQPEANWLSAFEAAIAQFPNALIGGYTVNALPENPYSTASQLLIDYLYSYYNQGPHQSVLFTSNNFTVPREFYQKIGGFDTQFPLAAGEDREFCDRWNHAGYQAYFTPDAKIKHYHQLQPSTFWRQHSNYGRGAYHFHLVRAQRDQTNIRIEPLQFYWNLLVFPYRNRTRHPALLITVLFFVSQVANTFGFFWEKWLAKTSRNLASPLSH